jgi:hypothetical protein
MTHVTLNLSEQECEELHASGSLLLGAIKDLKAEQGAYQTSKKVRTPFLGTRTIQEFNQDRAAEDIRELGLGDFFKWDRDERGKVVGFIYAESVTKLRAMLLMLEIGIEQGSLELTIEAEQGYLYVYTYLIRLVESGRNNQLISAGQEFEI